MVNEPEQNDPLGRLLILDAARRSDVEQKQQRVRKFLMEQCADALLLQDPANIAWFTAGADLFRFASESGRTSVFVTEEARLFATNAVDSAQIFEREVFGLGFQLKQREWFQPHEDLICDLCRGRSVLSDSGAAGTDCAGDLIAALRQPLTELEVTRLSRLGRMTTRAVEATAQNVRRGMTESEVAGELSHRLIRRMIVPVRIQVCADGRNARFRHGTYGEDPIESYVALTCLARRWGLTMGVSRTVAFESPPEELTAAWKKVVLMHATGQFFSRNGSVVSDVWGKVHRIYEKFGLSREWQQADQADVVGFSPSEQQVTPECSFVLQAPTAIFWHPSVGPAMVGDTVLVQDSSVEFLTSRRSWPKLIVHVRNRPVTCPGVLTIPDPGESTAFSENRQESAVAEELEAPDDEAVTCMDSIWEMHPESGRSVFEEDNSPWSEESVLE